MSAIGSSTNADVVGEPAREPWLGLNLAFTKDGMNQLLGANRPRMDPAFERGADHPETIAALNDPPPAKWVPASCPTASTPCS